MKLPNYQNYWIEAGFEDEMLAIREAIAGGEEQRMPELMSDRWLSRGHALRECQGGPRRHRRVVRRGRQHADRGAVVGARQPDGGAAAADRPVPLNGGAPAARRTNEETRMLKLDKPRDVFQHLGEELGPSEWLTVTQEMINTFAEATGDHQWIHVNVERAKRELPGGKTIAHGYLTLSLLPRLAPTLMNIAQRQPRRELRIEQGALRQPGAGGLAHPPAPAPGQRRGR